MDGLLPRELEARIEHLITARSGVYHSASNAGDSTASAPPRGSQAPGTYYLYNNWDFNAAGAVFEKLVGREIFDVVETDLATPIGMRDFDRKAQRKSGDPKRSQHLAYHMWYSTRDMARIGLLMLRDGQYITVLPELDMVVAHKTDTQQVSAHGDGKRRRSVTGSEYDVTLRMLIQSRTGR